LPVEPDQTYLVRARVRGIGRGVASVGVGWKTPEQRWTAHEARRCIVPQGEPDAEGYREAIGLVRVPAGVGYMEVMLSAESQAGPDDKAWFDDCRVLRWQP
jgi:hypothetical protein